MRFDGEGNQVADHSHIAIVSTSPDDDGNQFLIQSDYAGGITERDDQGNPLIGAPGVNEVRTIAGTIQIIFRDDENNDNPVAKEKGFFWAGEMPDIGVEP